MRLGEATGGSPGYGGYFQSAAVALQGQGLGASGTGVGGGGFIGVHGAGTGAGGIGVRGSAGTGTWAGFFDGDVHVNGTLSKTAGSFKIDHPLDPENKYLVHSFVESPDMKNVYDGVVVLDSSGEATVELPDYFEALNREFRYQLTCIGGFAPVYIAEEVDGNDFRIAGGEPFMKVSWQLTGVRKDPWAEQNRIEVEVAKPASARGTYLNPEVYGKAASRAEAVVAGPVELESD